VRADDPQLANTTAQPPLQERGADRTETTHHKPTPAFAELRAQLDHLRSQLETLPTDELTRLDELETRALALTEQRDQLRQELDQLPAPRRWRDRHVIDRTRLTSALSGAETQLEHTLSERARLARQIGDPEMIREEHDGLLNATQALRQTLNHERDRRAERELAANPAWAREALGERPEHGWARERWDHAAQTITRYRIEHDITDPQDTLGPPPSDPTQHADYEQAQQACEQLAHELGRNEPSHQLDLS
jgi:chromosome segregation ATPase